MNPTPKPRLLIVEDEPDLRELYQELLLGDFDCLSCSSGLEALEILKSNSIDLILSDWNFPNLSGLEFLAAVENQGFQGPFVFITGCSLMDLAPENFQHRVSGILEKPFSPFQLVSFMANVWKKAS